MVPVGREVPIGVRGGVPSGVSIFGGPVYAEDAINPVRFVNAMYGYGSPDGLGRYRR